MMLPWTLIVYLMYGDAIRASRHILLLSDLRWRHSEVEHCCHYNANISFLLYQSCMSERRRK